MERQFSVREEHAAPEKWRVPDVFLDAALAGADVTLAPGHSRGRAQRGRLNVSLVDGTHGAGGTRTTPPVLAVVSCRQVPRPAPRCVRIAGAVTNSL